MGNHKEYQILGISPDFSPLGITEGELRHQLWIRDQLNDQAMNHIPYRIRGVGGGASLLFYAQSQSLPFRDRRIYQFYQSSE
ncbi:MAG: hypothetical protein PQJ59_00535 [Spirochaetales bacterium]|nr:hypothetical protein [Spirochaetales bacterium]